MVSSIYTAQNNGFMSNIWKFASNFYFAFATGNIFLFLFLFINNYLLNNYLNFIVIDFIPVNKYNIIINVFLYIIIPIMVINYFLLFKDNRYKILIKEYSKSYSKKFFAWYFLLGFAFLFAILFLKVNKG